jgi:hypothetical protein
MAVAGLSEPAADAIAVAEDEEFRNAAAATTKLTVMAATKTRRERVMIVLLQGQTLSLNRGKQDRSLPWLQKEPYQILHTSAAGFTMGWPALQENASANSGMFTTTPLMR